MRFPDECCDFAVVRALREHGYDVLAVSEYQNRSEDPEVIAHAFADGRVLLTEDKDFGWLVFSAHVESPGVILIRFPAKARGTLAESVLKLVRDSGEHLRRAFVVLSPGSARINFRPKEEGL
jgi:predicted nuclease of predicted toxin-antitoxin system